MGDHVQWVIERRDRRYGGKGFPLGENLSLLAMGREIAGENLTVILDAQLTGQAENIKCPTDLIQTVFLAESRF